jgi:type VI secretion system protein ImpA
MIDLELLAKPISSEDPCGPDLDSEGDLAYLNFFASGESLLPMSYFEVKDSDGNNKRFDPNSIDLDAQLKVAKPLLARTRDLRLIVFLAKIHILGRDLASFLSCLEAIAGLLDQHWVAVHPRGEADDLSHRQYTIEAIDVLPTVIMPLQFHPLLNNRRYGPICYRTCLIAKGEITPREDDLVLDAGAVEQIFDTADIDQLKSTTAGVVALAAAVGRIKKIWSEKSDSGSVLNLDRLSSTVEGMAALLGTVIKRRDPGAAPSVEVGGQALEEGIDSGAPGALPSAQRVTSMAAAALALEAVASYFGRSEPSSPALLLVRQAQQMLGKSFAEALRILLPAHAEVAAINIGRDRFFDLPIERMASLLEGAPAPAAVVSEGQEQESAFSVASRSHALGLLEQVAAYFRSVEPSSPVPFLIDRARELAQRDFLSLLREVLPEGALRTIDNQG